RAGPHRHLARGPLPGRHGRRPDRRAGHRRAPRPLGRVGVRRDRLLRGGRLRRPGVRVRLQYQGGRQVSMGAKTRRSAALATVLTLAGGAVLTAQTPALAAAGWELKAMAVDKAHATTEGEGMTVAVLDTGIATGQDRKSTRLNPVT